MTILHISALCLMATPRIAVATNANIPLAIAELVIAALLFALLFVFRKRFLRLSCICGTVICLFLACKQYFGPDSILTQIMCWVTAAAACVLTVAIVNRIDWSALRGKPSDR